MWSIKQRRTKPRTVGNKVIYPKLNATATPNRYVNRNTYLDVKCNKDKGAGCTIVGCQCQTDASGNVYCCKTAPYRNPILGYRKHLVDCSGNTDISGCGYTNDVSGNVYKDNYAKSCGDPANSLVCYNPVIKLTQNRNGCVNESYNYSTNQYLTRRCLTFAQQEFNFQSQVPVDASGCCTKFRSCANCQYDLSGACDCSTNGFCTPCGHSQACIGINKLPCEVKNTKCFAIYKRSNPKFNHQGAVSGGSRINRLKYQTRVVAAQRRKANGRNNVINRRGPAALYTTSRPLTLRDTTCVNPPPGPVDLSSVELSPFTFTINWSIANITELCRIAPLTGFTLQRTGSSFGHTVTLGSGSRTYTYTGIVTGLYNVRIKSDSYYGSSDWTYLNNIYILTPPAPITDLSGAAGNEQVELSWTAPDEGGAAITDYEYKKDSDAWISFVSLDTSGVITGLTNGTEYTFMVRAVNVIGAGAESNSVSATPSTTPDAPTGLAVSTGNLQVELSWTAPDDGGSAITDYEYKKDSDAWISFVSLDTSGVITGLTNGTEYTFMVRAVNVIGAGAESNSVSATPGYSKLRINGLTTVGNNFFYQDGSDNAVPPNSILYSYVYWYIWVDSANTTFNEGRANSAAVRIGTWAVGWTDGFNSVIENYIRNFLTYGSTGNYPNVNWEIVNWYPNLPGDDYVEIQLKNGSKFKGDEVVQVWGDFDTNNNPQYGYDGRGTNAPLPGPGGIFAPWTNFITFIE